MLPQASDSSGLLAAAVLSNQSAAAYIPGAFQPEQNRVPYGSFEWTNRGLSRSSIDFLPSGESTNKR
jgi:hypothetical protein